MVKPSWRKIWQYIVKLYIHLSFDLRVSLLEIHSKDLMAKIRKGMCMRLLIAALFIVAKAWKQLKCPSVEKWLNKVQYIHMGVMTP